MSNYSLDKISTIGVIGAGTMGAGIAQAAAASGYHVILFDLKEDFTEKAISIITKNLDGAVERAKLTEQDKSKALEQIIITTNLEEVKADLIIEAVLEKLEIKIDVFNQLAKYNNETCIFATNTSTIPITSIANAVPTPERVVGMHFFNPVHIMKLVEVISGKETDPDVARTVRELAEKMGKKPAMANDSPGFIVNRVARHFYVEGLKVLEDGISDHENIDKILEASGFRMGPFKLMDLIGVDTNLSVTRSMYESFNKAHKFKPSPIQEKKVADGLHGKKTGKGFYSYE